jgi:xanthine dehydrogenase/oxidase
MAGHSYVLQKKCENSKISCADIEDIAGSACCILSLLFASSAYVSSVAFPDGNLCRCTGVRPLLTALKTLADAEDQEKDKVPPAHVPDKWGMGVQEDWSKLVPSHDAIDRSKIANLKISNPISNLPTYYQPTDLTQLFAAWDSIPDKHSWPIKFQFGNTGTGIYPDLVPFRKGEVDQWYQPKFRIDLTEVKELRNIDDSATNPYYGIGSCVTYTRFIAFLKSKLNELKVKPNPVEKQRLLALRYLAQRTAGHQIRNRASLGGNTMMTVLHRFDPKNPPFPSDLCTALIAAEASVTIRNLEAKDKPQLVIKLRDFLTNAPAAGSYLLTGYQIPKARVGEVTYTDTYKTAVRHTMSHSYTNGGITMTITLKGSDVYLSNATMVFGGVGPTNISTIAASRLAQPKKLNDDLVSALLGDLNTELGKWWADFEAWKTKNNAQFAYSGEVPAYLISLGVSYLYKYLVTVASANGIKIDPRVESVSWPDLIPVNHAEVVYESSKKPTRTLLASTTDSNPAAFAHLPLIKYEAYAQTTGEVKYVREAPVSGHGVYFSWVYAKRIGTFAYKWAGPQLKPREAVKDYFAFKYGSAVVDYLEYESLSQNPNINIDMTFSPAVGQVLAETLIIKNQQSNCVGDRIGIVVATTEDVVTKMADELMNHGFNWSAADPKTIKLKMEDYQPDPKADPNPELWKNSRLIFPSGGVSVPQDAIRDKNADGKFIVCTRNSLALSVFL